MYSLYCVGVVIFVWFQILRHHTKLHIHCIYWPIHNTGGTQAAGAGTRHCGGARAEGDVHTAQDHGEEP